MKPNYSTNPAPSCFNKTISLNKEEYKMMLKVLSVITQYFSEEMSVEDTLTINNIVDKLETPSHDQSN